MEADNPMSDDRRRFFRIDDHIGVSYQVVDENELIGQHHPPRQSDIFALLNDLDKTIVQELEELKLRDPKLGVLMEAFDRKLNAVVNQLEIDNYLVQRIAHKVKQVNISACGMGLQVEEPLREGDLLMVDLVLIPGNINIFTYGRVISSEAAAAEEYYIRLDFFGMSTTDQELLIQHIVRRQSYLIRSSWS
ncbi:PilZ domain-containing protein [Halioxenophilus sp. WMMB6]|uniref:PilZ domain-containing protein n=1 Tax=Halioxenophilus sp. WMMB6 TaxID=3073815 RepID=UPI00295F496F|nr:PilZ domain-containing protein [Halioxenophilus sp. WMMB6]